MPTSVSGRVTSVEANILSVAYVSVEGTAYNIGYSAGATVDAAAGALAMLQVALFAQASGRTIRLTLNGSDISRIDMNT